MSSHVEDRDVWERLDPAWHAGFAGFAVVTAVLLVVSRPDHPVLAFVLLGGIVAAYAAAGGPALHRGGKLGAAYLAVAGPLTLALFTLAPVGAVMLFVLFPLIWRLLPTRAAVVATVVTMAALGAIGLFARGTDPADTPALLALFGGALVAAVLLGLWITTISSQSARRAALLEELDRTRAELAAANREAGALAERERLARDIHDTLAQGFTSLVLLVRAVSDELDRDPEAARRHLDLAGRTARDNLAETRALVRAMTPAPLAEAPLPAALRRIVDDVGGELGIAVSFALEGPDGPLPGGHDVALLRLTQEAIANVRKHAGATRLEVRLTRDGAAETLLVSDDGRGFDPGSPRSGFGLDNMRSRAAELGGTVTVDSAPGAGCRLEVRLPARSRQAA
ncbi:sensor histidine kinase [Pseudonocardia sulfidoxydans]|uniref:sensor histidine kinase n=1 Tax=Pseudonocardia sulfidoxydans TaxID=54011 RepID=UPI0011BEF036|nr:sensor histidine kinase [Pseudonocardia sulfidoxydans]